MIQISNLTFRIAGRLLVDQANITIPEGKKIGLVGRNGTGKTTLFKVLLGEIEAESGQIKLPNRARIGQVAQEAPATQDSLIEIVLAADTERAQLIKEAEIASDANRIGQIHERLSEIGSYSAHSRAATILSGLGFDEQAQNRPAASFSGGWRMRVALAAILFAEPEVLLLDEPTNYLDLEGTLWLHNYMTRYPHTAIIISHDRNLLNTVVSGIVHLENKKLTYYGGPYDTFARLRSEKIMHQSKLAQRQEAQREHLQAFVDRFKAKASKARQAQSRVKMLEKMQPSALILDETVAPLSFPNPLKPVASPIISLDGVSCGYEETQPVLTRLNLRIDSDDRIALLGANGNGKSTFAKLICSRLKPLSGEMNVSEKLRIGMFAQHQLDDLVAEQTPFEHIRALSPDEPESRLRSRVAQMGLGSEKMDTKAKNLSGGEKARLLLGLMTIDQPHLLILDEPTNHLDIETRSALIDGLNAYSGAVILISHDRHLIETTAERLWIVGEGTVTPYDGDMAGYQKQLLKYKKSSKAVLENKQSASSENGEIQNGDGQGRLLSESEIRRKFAPLRKQISGLERQLDAERQNLAIIDNELAMPDLFQKNPEKGGRLAKQRTQLQDKIDELEEEWLEKSEEYESQFEQRHEI